MTSGISMADGIDRSTSKPLSPGISMSRNKRSGRSSSIFHSTPHLISVGLRSDPQVAWTGLRSQAVLQRIFHNGLKHQRGNLLHGDRRVDGDLDLKPAAEPSFFNLQIRL